MKKAITPVRAKTASKTKAVTKKPAKMSPKKGSKN